MASYLMIADGDNGPIVGVEATVSPAPDGQWLGRVTSLPFTEVTATGTSHNQTRHELAQEVLQRVRAGVLPVSPQVGAVRVFSTSISEHPRGGDFTGPVINVPATADRLGGAWTAWTSTAAGPLAGQTAEGETMALARDGLATTLMLALEVGVEGIEQEWSGIRLLIRTRKTYATGVLLG